MVKALTAKIMNLGQMIVMTTKAYMMTTMMERTTKIHIMMTKMPKVTMTERKILSTMIETTLHFDIAGIHRNTIVSVVPSVISVLW
jgi:hypothetical protein